MMVIHGDCLEQMATLPAESVDSIVTDPPYGLSFMGKDWDHGVPGEAFWREALRVAKPGAHLLAFGGSRTYHRLACAIEDAGWEIRDCIMYVFGSGFPKSHDVSKAIDREAGAEREIIGSKISRQPTGNAYAQDKWTKAHSLPQEIDVTAPATDAAKQWQGWGTALKPSYEPIIVARKPLIGTVAANVQQYGTGAINVDGCRVGYDVNDYTARLQRTGNKTGIAYGHRGNVPLGNGVVAEVNASGRWPANFIHDSSDEVVGLFPVTGASKASNRGLQHSGRHGGLADIGGNIKKGTDTIRGHDDTGGSAARFFYTSKASKRDRDEGVAGVAGVAGVGALRDSGRESLPRKNHHPTVKPTDLMRYLCRLVTPPGGVVLDPFMGSGSTGKGAILEGFNFIGIEQNAEYIEIAKARIAFARTQTEQEPAKVGSSQTSLFDKEGQ